MKMIKIELTITDEQGCTKSDTYRVDDPQELYRDFSEQGYVLINSKITPNYEIKQDCQEELNKLYGRRLKAQIFSSRTA